jgi:site-specific recombinase XerD
MRTTNTFGIQFVIKKNKIKDNRAPIYARVTVNSHRVEISLKRWIDPKEWNTDKSTCRGSREAIKSLNHFLAEVKASMVQSYQELQIQKRRITAEEIKNKFLGIGKEDNSICKLIDYHNTHMKDILTWGTMKNYFTTQKYIQKFLKVKFSVSDISLTELNYKFITDFEYFLRAHKPIDHHKPIANNGVMKHIERLRKMINLAVRMEWLDKDPFAKYKQKFDKVSRGFLTQEELLSVENLDPKIPRLRVVRDLFVFSCYSGLAYIDVMQLTPQNLTRGIDGEQWLITSRQKTKNSVRIPLLPKALEIIQTYGVHPRAVAAGKLFPLISNQKLNSYLKELADLCGVEKNMTFHLARHTFATTVTLTNGVPIESVSKMLGHSKITTTQIYAKVIERKLSDDMKNLKEKLSKVCLNR